jgi:hypothetical protein
MGSDDKFILVAKWSVFVSVSESVECNLNTSTGLQRSVWSNTGVEYQLTLGKLTHHCHSLRPENCGDCSAAVNCTEGVRCSAYRRNRVVRAVPAVYIFSSMKAEYFSHDKVKQIVQETIWSSSLPILSKLTVRFDSVCPSKKLTSSVARTLLTWNPSCFL